jgi:hypothetical protein
MKLYINTDEEIVFAIAPSSFTVGKSVLSGSV